MLTFWLVVRHRSLGPQTMRWSMIACAVAFALLKVVAQSIASVATATDTAVALLCMVVPAFGFAF